ncbi:unnamed protein product [Soboliphyme baturini]|uniref:Uncharacterized protein n=1 Tax=Soboliphyme baturini TaxID=241478 RepID=A0A183IL88_9BILA|nr:unnamed protein product [Soboliphyme baturini]
MLPVGEHHSVIAGVRCPASGCHCTDPLPSFARCVTRTHAPTVLRAAAACCADDELIRAHGPSLLLRCLAPGLNFAQLRVNPRLWPLAASTVHLTSYHLRLCVRHTSPPPHLDSASLGNATGNLLDQFVVFEYSPYDLVDAPSLKSHSLDRRARSERGGTAHMPAVSFLSDSHLTLAQSPPSTHKLASVLDTRLVLLGVFYPRLAAYVFLVLPRFMKPPWVL